MDWKKIWIAVIILLIIVAYIVPQEPYFGCWSQVFYAFLLLIVSAAVVVSFRKERSTN